MQIELDFVTVVKTLIEEPVEPLGDRVGQPSVALLSPSVPSSEVSPPDHSGGQLLALAATSLDERTEVENGDITRSNADVLATESPNQEHPLEFPCLNDHDSADEFADTLVVGDRRTPMANDIDLALADW